MTVWSDPNRPPNVRDEYDEEGCAYWLLWAAIDGGEHLPAEQRELFLRIAATRIIDALCRLADADEYRRAA